MAHPLTPIVRGQLRGARTNATTANTADAFRRAARLVETLSHTLAAETPDTVLLDGLSLECLQIGAACCAAGRSELGRLLSDPPRRTGLDVGLSDLSGSLRAAAAFPTWISESVQVQGDCGRLVTLAQTELSAWADDLMAERRAA